MADLLIREAVPADIDAITELDELCFPEMPWSRESYEEELTANNLAVYLVAETEEKIIGFVGIWLVLDEGHITNVAVHPDYRRRHVAQSLINIMLSLVEDEGIIAETLEVRAGNEPAKALYRGFGFKEAGIRRGYYPNNHEDAIIMWRGREI